MENQILTEKEQSKKIKFLNVINEGTRWFSFVLCPTNIADVIIYAWLDDLKGTTHTTIYNLAVEEYGFNEKYEPVGGGVVNTKTCEIQDSIHFGRVDDSNVIKAIMRKTRCESA